MKSLNDFKVKNKRVLVRCDFNVPLDESGNILDDFRIKKALPTIEYLAKEGAKVVLMSHFGDPEKEIPNFKSQNASDGEIADSELKKYSLEPVGRRLKELLGQEVFFSSNCIGEKTEKTASELESGEILLLENLRFHKEEKENNPQFAKDLAKLGDIYVNEAFSVSHRAHASVAGVPEYLPSCAGFQLEKEIQVLKNLVENPAKPLTVIIGGAKVESKAKLIKKFLQIADSVLVSGLIQKEINEKNMEFESQEKIISPLGDLGALDISQETVKIFAEKINLSKTVFWNGPVGKFEDEEFAKGTKAIAETIISSSAFSIIGGGETVEFVNKLGLADKFNHVSTGGGAMMEFLSGEKLPGLKALGNYGN